jgi:hypothetical protein
MITEASVSVRTPFIKGALLSLATLLIGATALILADFGQPMWVFVPLLAWLATVGLPTSIAVIILASSWGRVPAATGILPFVICSLGLGTAFHSAYFLLRAKVARRSAR